MPKLKFKDSNGVLNGVEPNKNWIIDGGFQVAQAVPTVGTEVTDPATATYPVCDMWKWDFAKDGGTDPTIKHSRQKENGESFYRINVNGAGASYGVNSNHRMPQIIENGVRILCGTGKKATLSFQARSDIANKKLGIYLVCSYGTGGSPSATESIIGTTFDLTTDWATYTHTFDTDILTDKTFGTEVNDTIYVCVIPQWGGTWGSTRVNSSTAETFGGAGNIDIRRVKLEEGDAVTPFEQEPFAEALQKCMRYYEKSYKYEDAPTTNTVENMYITNVLAVASANGGRWILGKHPRFKVGKRVNPTIKLYTYDGTENQWYVGGANRACAINSFKESFNLLNNTGGLVTPTEGEVYGHYIADARF